MTQRIAIISPQSKARAAGIAWLITFITGAFAMFIGGRFVVNTDAAATATNILANEFAFRLGTAGNLIATVCYLVATLLVYELLKPVNRTVSLIAAFFSLLGCAVGAIVSLLNFAPLTLLGGAFYLSAFNIEQLQALTLTVFRFAARANEVGLIFFGLHIFLVGYLILKSTFLLRFLGVLLMIGGICYFGNSFASFLEISFVSKLFPLILMPAFVAELLLTLWLIVKGVNVARWNEQAEGSLRFDV
jgi:Domain of unknown function (DUF4386)